MEANCQLHPPVALHTGERASGTHWIGSWVGPRAGLDSLSFTMTEIRPLFQRLVNYVEVFKLRLHKVKNSH